ncbi:MAG: TonB-dependent receptor, partial [Bacteroidota bacterium]
PTETGQSCGKRSLPADYLLELLGNSELRDNQMSFYDLIGKFHHKFNNGDRLGVTAYRSFDRFQLASDTLLDYTEFSYSNTVLSAYYDKQISSSIDAAFNVAMSKYNYDINYDRLVTQAFNIGFELNEFNGAADFVFYQNDKLQHNFGGAFKRYDIRPGKRDPLGEVSLIAEDQIDSEQAIQQDAYYAVDYEPNEKWNLNAGIRYSIFSNVGPYTAYDYDVGFTNRIDSTTFSEGDIGNTYHGPEWRFSSRYFLNPSTSLKASLSRNRQYVHLLINAASIAPNDVWRLSNENIQPQIADQVSLGIFKNFYKDHVIETSVEVYAKQLQNLLDFKTGTDLQFNKAIETGVLQGPGRSYGLEFNIKKSSGWFTGWLNYTYSRTFIQLEGATPDQTINQGEFFPANYDRPHYLNSVTNYKFTRRFSLAVNMVFASGIPATYPVGKWDFQGTENIYYSDRNEFRLPNYFRLDLGLNIEGNHKMKKLAHSFWTISLYNALGWDNVYSVFFRVEDGEVAGYEMKVFPNPIPTITYNFSF